MRGGNGTCWLMKGQQARGQREEPELQQRGSLQIEERFMFDAQMLITTGTDHSVFSPWMLRGGDNLRATLEVVKRGSSATITVRVFTKNSEDAGDGADADSATTLAGGVAGRYVAEWASNAGKGAKAMVRYKFTVSGAEGDWTLFRMLPATWFDSVSA